MGGAAGKQKSIQHKSFIFHDEGIGIEQSNISRKWTKKLSLYRNIDQEIQKSESKRFSQFFIQKEDESDSIIYSDSESDLTEKQELEINKQQLRNRRTQIRLKSQVIEDGIVQKFLNKKEKNDSDIEESSDEEQRKRIISKQRIGSESNRKKDSDEEYQNDGSYIELKRQISNLVNSGYYEEDDLDTINDLALLDELDIEPIQKHYNIKFPSMQDKDLFLKRMYIRTRMGQPKAPIGQEKKIKFDAKQDEIFDIYEESESSNSEHEQQFKVLSPKKEYTPQNFLENIGLSIVCKKGNKKEDPHKNDYFIYSDTMGKMIALINGHGEHGHILSNISYKIFFSKITKMAEYYSHPKKAIEIALIELQSHIRDYFDKKKGKEQYQCILSGCAITVIIQRNQKLFIGHLGDNRITIYKEIGHNNKPKKIVADICPLHSPIDPNEKKRIYAAGGEVRQTSSMNHHIFVKGRLYPKLHITRSIGDLLGHVIGVLAQPFIKEYDVTVNDSFLLLSTFQTFLYMEQDEITNHLEGFSLTNIKQACDSLYKKAKSSWIVSEGVWDDMTIITMWLGGFKQNN